MNFVSTWNNRRSDNSPGTSDNAPLLQMEARQKLERAISLRCCSRVRVAILNTDRYPGTVSLELILTDRHADASRSGTRYFGSGS